MLLNFVHWPCVLQPCWTHLLVLFFLVNSWRFSVYMGMSSVFTDSFTSYFPTWMPFSCLIALSRTSSTVLNRSGKNGILAVFLILEWKIFIFFFFFLPQSVILALEFPCTAFIMLRQFYSISSLLRVFSHKRMSNFVKCFFCINCFDHVVFLQPVNR